MKLEVKMIGEYWVKACGLFLGEYCGFNMLN